MGHCKKCEGYLGHSTACLTRDGMQSEVQVVLTVMCSASNNFSIIIYSVFCLTTGSKPPPKRILHIVRFRASIFK